MVILLGHFLLPTRTAMMSRQPSTRRPERAPSSFQVLLAIAYRKDQPVPKTPSSPAKPQRIFHGFICAMWPQFTTLKIHLDYISTPPGEPRATSAQFGQGHAERLISAGCMVPFPLHVEHSRGEGVTICMTKVEGRRRLPCSLLGSL